MLAAQVLDDKALAADPAFATNVERVKRRGETDARVQAAFGALDADTLTAKLEAAKIAFARVSDLTLFARHPHLRRITVASSAGPVSYPAPPVARDEAFGPVPALGEHGERLRREFASACPGSTE